MEVSAPYPLFSDVRLKDLLKARGSGAAKSARGNENAGLPVPRLRLDDIAVEAALANGDTSSTHDRKLVTVSLPFDGDPILLRCRPSRYTFSPPRASVMGDLLRLIYEVDGETPDALSTLLAADIREINLWLSWLREDLSSAALLAVKAGNQCAAT